MHDDRREAPRPGRSPFVSVIVPVRDDGERIRDLVRLLSAQTLPRGQFEVVIGDDGSSDGSLAGVATEDGWVRVVRGPRQNSYGARNRAVTASAGDLLAFCDSDCAPEPTWLEEGVAALREAGVAAGDVRYAAPARPTAWSLLTVDMYLDQQNNVLLSRAVTANLFVRRPVFLELGGFDESLPSGGDFDFVRRAVEAGARLVYSPAAIVRHPTLDDRRSFLRKVRRTNRWAVVRRGREGGRPNKDTLASFVPLCGVRKARVDALRPPWRLQRARLEAAGLAPSRWQELRALVVLFTVVGYAAAFARALAWVEVLRPPRASPASEPSALPESQEVTPPVDAPRGTVARSGGAGASRWDA
jgi:GT2 family glycosyltransferase